MRFAFAKKEERERTRTEREETPRTFRFCHQSRFCEKHTRDPILERFRFYFKTLSARRDVLFFFLTLRGVRFCWTGPMPMIAARRQRRARPWATGGSDRRVEAGAGAGRSA